MESGKIVSRNFRRKAVKILYDFIKCDLHYFLKSKDYKICEMKTKRYYKNYGYMFWVDELIIDNDFEEELWFSKSDIVKHAKPLKYKQKNNYIKGYNKN
jgi:hypothetical protein